MLPRKQTDSQEKLKRKFQELLLEIQFGLTSFRFIQRTESTRELWCGDWSEQVKQIQTIFWIHRSSVREKAYALGQLASGDYFYLRVSLNCFDFLENECKITFAKDASLLIEKDMSKRAHRSYMRKTVSSA